MTTSIEVLDLGINNLTSLVHGLRNSADVDVRAIAHADDHRSADLLVLPGVGAFGAAVRALDDRGLRDVALAHVAEGGALFGVCLGMQLLTESSEESPGYPGLGLVPGETLQLPTSTGARVPNMGWACARPTEAAMAFPSFHRGVDYYFVHSYAVHPADPADVLSWSDFGDRSFASGIIRAKVLGVQFHPEKSSFGGQRLLTEVVEWALG